MDPATLGGLIGASIIFGFTGIYNTYKFTRKISSEKRSNNTIINSNTNINKPKWQVNKLFDKEKIIKRNVNGSLNLVL